MDRCTFESGVVSIIMPAYNAERYIAQAIDSVLAQTYSQWELIIVNDGSSDSTPDILERYTDARIKVFHQVNDGESGARNTALRHVQGEWIAFLDADDLYLPHHLDVTAAYLETHPDYGGVYTDGYYCDQNGVQLRTLSSRRRGPFEGDIFEQMVRASDVFGAPVSVVLRSAVVDRYGICFDSDIVIGPDWDFLTRVAEVSTFGFVNLCTCMYRVHQQNISVRVKQQQRALSLARCREKAIKMDRFGDCSIETQAWVFYDLLINLLTEWPDKQAGIVEWAEFSHLPVPEQARLFRLMASKALLHELPQSYIRKWLRRSKDLNPTDRIGAVLGVVFRINPQLCKAMLSARTVTQTEALEKSPFVDLFTG